MTIQPMRRSTQLVYNWILDPENELNSVLDKRSAYHLEKSFESYCLDTVGNSGVLCDLLLGTIKNVDWDRIWNNLDLKPVRIFNNFELVRSGLNKYTSFGCYPILYLIGKDCLCPDCALDHVYSDDEYDRYIPMQAEINYSPSTYCDQCGETIESCYPTEDQEDEDTSDRNVDLD